MDDPPAFAHPSAYWPPAQHSQQHYPTTVPLLYPTYSASSSWYPETSARAPDANAYYENTGGVFSPGGRYYPHRRFHPYFSTDSELAHALHPMPQSSHAPYPASLAARPTTSAPLGYDHVFHEQLGVVPTGSCYDHPQPPPSAVQRAFGTSPVQHSYGTPASSSSESHALQMQYSARHPSPSAEPYQERFSQPCTPVKTEQSYSDPAALYGEYSLPSPDPSGWLYNTSPTTYTGDAFVESPTRPVTPAWPYPVYSPSGTLSSLSSGTNGTWSSVQSDASLTMPSLGPAPASTLSPGSAPASSSAPTPTPALSPKQEEEEADEAELLSEPAASASPPAFVPSSSPAAPARKRGSKAKAGARHTHRPLACHACRVRKIACLEDAGAKCAPCARRGRECVFPAENGRGKHKVAQKEERLRREAEARRALVQQRA